MLELIDKLDKDLLLFLNGRHNEFFDFLMWWISDKFIWIPFYLFLIFLLYRFNPKKWWAIFLFGVVAVALADLASVELFKNVFKRLRPSHAEDLLGLVRNINDYKGGQYGFVSSHAANMFAVATFFSLFLKRNIKYIGWVLFPWAALIGYSRIYLGVHYPGDVICGALLGISVASIIALISKRILSRF